VAREPQQGGQQGEGHRHHERHGQTGHQAHDGDRRDAGDREPADGDDHRHSGEQDRGAGRGDGPPGGLLDGHPEAQVLAVAGDDEQGVVDADAQTDHRGQGGGHGVHVDDRGDQGDQAHAGHQADQGDPDR
jgi:hypothetical protein